MNFIQKFLANLFTEKKYKSNNQDQNEALIDCLALAVVVDGVIETSELAEINDAIKMFEWQSDVAPQDYVDQALDHAAEVLVEESALRVFASDIAERLDEEWLREEAYYISARIVSSDKDLVEEERLFLNALVESMAITPKHLQNITQKLMEDMKF